MIAAPLDAVRQSCAPGRVRAVRPRSAPAWPRACRRDGAPIVSAFYYPWFGTTADDGEFAHWAQGGHVAAGRHRVELLPGARRLLVRQTRGARRADGRDRARAGIDRDRRLVVGEGLGRGPAPAGGDRGGARAAGIAVAAHIEPYRGRTVASSVDDIAYLQTLGHPDVLRLPAVRPAGRATGRPRTTRCARRASTMFAQTALVGAAATGHFTGVYTYDIARLRRRQVRAALRQAHAHGLLCAPSVGPGLRRAAGDRRRAREAAPRRRDLRLDVAARRSRAGADR